MTSQRYAFVVPRYAAQLAGGAESLAGALATELQRRGDEVLLLATCARDNRTWENFYPAGDALEGGLPVKRFPVDERNLDRWIPLQIRVSEGMQLSLDEQLDWLAESVNSRALYSYLVSEQQRFKAIFFAPYMFGTTFWGSLLCAERAVLIPCLHDEVFAQQEVIGGMFRRVRGALFNASPEQDLARALYGDIRGGEVGMGFRAPSAEIVAQLSPYFSEQFPYVLYVGRKETMKNVPLLIDYFCAAKDKAQIPAAVKLVIAGAGSFSDLHRPQALTRSDVLDIDHVSEHDKQRLMKYALCVCQPSTNESFSIVLMEAWMVGAPVLVHARCLVTREHVVASSGGLFFADQHDFAAVTCALLQQVGLRQRLAQAGLQYVRTRYAWPAVLERFDAALQEIFGESRCGRGASVAEVG